MSQRPLRILTIGHSHIVGMNRAMWRKLAEDPGFNITVAAPSFFRGDLRPLTIDAEPAGSKLQLAPLDASWTGWIHGFRYHHDQLRKLIREGEFDLVHAWEEPYIYAGFQIARCLRDSPARFAFRTAQNLFKRYPPPFSYFERTTLRRAQAWIAGGNLVYRTMLRRGYPADRGRILSLSVDLDAFHPLLPERRGEVLKELGIEPPVLGFVGRLSSDKGLDLLIQCLELLPPELSWSLLLLGSGPYKGKMEAWAKSRGWQNRVRVTLARHDKAAQYVAAMDLMLAPSQTTRHWREQFGRMIVEAFACGVPVIGSDSGEIPFVVADAGLVLPEHDPAAWAKAIEVLLPDLESRRMLAQRGLQRVARYSSTTVAAQFGEFYRWLAEQPVESGTKSALLNGSLSSRVKSDSARGTDLANPPIVPVGVASSTAAGKALVGKTTTKESAPRILAFATQGSGGNDETRLRALLGLSSAEFFPFDYADKWGSFRKLLRKIRTGNYDLAVMEGTGAAGGLALVFGKLLYRTQYVVSSGDAVGPFLTARWPLLKPLFSLYEHTLCKHASGFIGWTPYLVGRALTLGSPRGMTAAGWAMHGFTAESISEARQRIREQLGIPPNAIVFGLVGSLVWTKRVRYCYGWELVQAIRKTQSPDLRVLIVGDGNGRSQLETLAGNLLGSKVILTGRVPREQVNDYLAAMDVASLPQSVDGVGSFRYSTKLSEYLALKLPTVTNHIPASYDLDYGEFWRLPGECPWDARYIENLATLMDKIDREAIVRKVASIPDYIPEFQRDFQIARVTEFLNDILSRGN